MIYTRGSQIVDRYALRFDGVNDHVAGSSAAVFNGMGASFQIEFWMAPLAVWTSQNVFSWGNGATGAEDAVYLAYGAGTLQFVVRRAGVTLSATAPYSTIQGTDYTNKWVYVVLQLSVGAGNAAVLNTYFDGNLVGTITGAAGTSGLFNIQNGLTLGALRSAAGVYSAFFPGKIAYFRTGTYLYSVSEMWQIMRNPGIYINTGYRAGLVCDIAFQQTSGTTAPDTATGAPGDATLVNFSVSGPLSTILGGGVWCPLTLFSTN